MVIFGLPLRIAMLEALSEWGLCDYFAVASVRAYPRRVRMVNIARRRLLSAKLDVADLGAGVSFWD